jgi:PPK2 family polyphosphate:nucleotide phosphotransferase
MMFAIKVAAGEKVRLADIDPSGTPHLSKEEAPDKLAELSRQLGQIHELLCAAQKNSLLIVLQGMDTSGKDGTIKRVMADVNPQGCRVESFKVPTPEELAHDFLWRVHRVAPARGTMAIFNRSHYEDVLIVRVHRLVADDVWKRRFDQINNFERLLAESGTIIIKFFLHISLEEQEERLKEREADVAKAWKLSAGDWKERERWAEYCLAYEEALTRCSTEFAPWYVIPADKKWYRDVAVAGAIVHEIKPYRDQWEETLSEMSSARLAEIRAMRQSQA